MFHWLDNRRARIAERMDDDRADPTQLRNSLAFIRRVNRFLGYTRAILQHFDRFSRRWDPDCRIDILDLATGSADIPRAILAWASRRRFNVRIVGVDRHPLTARLAAAGNRDPRLTIVRADVFDLPFAPASFDYALTAMFLHHLDEGGIVRVLRTMDSLCRRGLVATDLLRHRRAYAWVRLLTAFSPSMVRHDAAASVAQALTRAEALRLRDAAGISYVRYHRHFAHRFALAGEKC